MWLDRRARTQSVLASSTQKQIYIKQAKSWISDFSSFKSHWTAILNFKNIIHSNSNTYINMEINILSLRHC